MAGFDEQWLASGEESALEPELPICDPHHHMWDYPGRRYMLDELLVDTAHHNILKTVFVEAGSSLFFADQPPHLAVAGETAAMDAVAEASLQRGGLQANAGIVGFADLMLGEAVEEVLQAHLRQSPTRFRGVRHSGAWHASDAIRESHAKPPPHMYMLEQFRRGFGRLRKYDLSFEAWMFHTQIDELADLAGAFEDTSIVLNHMGGPLGIGPYAGKRDEVFPVWKDSIAALAKRPNVVAKLGGINMAINGFGWHERDRPPSSQELSDAIRPYCMHVIECFGVQRCMFQANWPADKVSSSYTVLWNAFKRVAEGFSDDEKAALFHDTAVRVYRL